MHQDEDTYFYSRSQYLSWFKRYREGNFPAVKDKLQSLYGKEFTSSSQFKKTASDPINVPYGGGKTLQIKYEPIQIEPGQTLDCIAIFPDISAEADYIGVLIEGASGPVIVEDDWKKSDGMTPRAYVERKALLACFARIGDEFKRDQDKIEYLGKKWIVVERYPVDFGKDEFRASDQDVVPPNTWSDEMKNGQDGAPSLRDRNKELVEDK